MSESSKCAEIQKQQNKNLKDLGVGEYSEDYE